MTEIRTELQIHPLPNHQWKLEKEFVVNTDAAGLITVPEGFVCDLTSIPRFLWWESLPSDYAEAAVPHDWAYKGNLDRPTADKVYREVAIAIGMPAWRANLRYVVLRWFGGSHYKPNQTQERK
ncbi:MAG TPA: DUF1353 domain-containing protein [Anaerovoracaceae bacterium]|nr:DUF1353 domain-containing protein [Anaerovoracaceae bacterium]